MAIKIESIETGKFTMEFFRFGNGDRTYVILPGLSVKSVMPLADAVAEANKIMHDDFTAYVFDPRRDIPEGYSIEDMARDTAEAIMELGLKDIYLFGASMGGMIAMTIAIEHPELVKKLVLGSSSSHVKEEQRKVIESWVDLAKKRDGEGLYLEFAKEVYPPQAYEGMKDYLISEGRTVTDEEFDKFIILAESIKSFDVSDKVDQIKCPVLAIGVFEDAVLDSDATMEIAEKLDEREDFRLYMYIGYGHAAYDIAPDYLQRIKEFFIS